MAAIADIPLEEIHFKVDLWRKISYGAPKPHWSNWIKWDTIIVDGNYNLISGSQKTYQMYASSMREGL